MKAPLKLDAAGFELLVLIAYSYGEISEGRAQEILGWKRERIREEAFDRIGPPHALYARLANHLGYNPAPK